MASRKPEAPRVGFLGLYVDKLSVNVNCNCNRRHMQRGLGTSLPNMTTVYTKKFTNYSMLLLTPLECPYENFSPYRIFSAYLPLADGGENVQISSPTPEIEGPKEGKFWGTCCKN